jgi:hypothetical protein
MTPCLLVVGDIAAKESASYLDAISTKKAPPYMGDIAAKAAADRAIARAEKKRRAKP